MSIRKSPRIRGRYGRAGNTRFVEVEMPPVAASHLVVEVEGGGRILLSEPAHVAWVAQLLVTIAGHRQGGCS